MRFRSIFKIFDTYGQPVSMYHSGRKHLKTNFGGFVRIASFVLVCLYVYYILLLELDDSAKDITISKVMAAVESELDANK